ncbi:nucleotide exchange factor GrpE [Candidatus Protochlamydia phocaeensis]|uniref:nucleotide exchange factor GrpE n=1 Tax=Candidatus Protochlamydia phocaeensis TaxID=1414722 RepID=UPI000838A2E3|nr:nucleotide exchange factor GrpE [Candidatus Protochlamydia phocaeensis]
MTDESSKNDPSSNWPKDVREAYESLKLPSLYDCVLENERLSLELRKQGRDIKIMAENMGKMVSQFDSLLMAISEEWEEYEEEPEGALPAIASLSEKEGELTDLEIELLNDRQAYLEKQSQEAFIEIADAIFDLSQYSKQMSHQVLNVLPKKEGLLAHLPYWHPLVENLIGLWQGQVNHLRYKMLARLENMHIYLIDPQSGEEFNEDEHQALERIAGGQMGKIAQTIRVGYRHGNKILRQAAVAIFV